MNIYKENITSDYQQFFEDDYNVIIYAGEDPYVKEFHAHSVVLRCRSRYFRTALSPIWAEKKDEMYILKKPNISGNIFQIILRYIYSGTINFSQIEPKEYLGLLEAADELTFDRIRDCCLKIICHKADVLFESEKFLTLPPRILELLLQRDEVALNEIDIWNYLIKWAHARNPTVELDPLKWTDDDIKMMKRTIDSLIPLIRFQNIFSKDDFDKLCPYKKLLQKKVISSLSRSMKSNNFDSSIINKTHKYIYHSLFTSWINQKDHCRIRNFTPYNFNLIFRGSQDGFDGKSFHRKCNNRGPTLLIVKIKNSNQIVGGYNPLGWEGNGSKNTSDSFIFSIDNYKNVNSGRISRVIDTKRAVRCFDKWGPIFGAYNMTTKSNDLMMKPNGEWISIPSSYPNLNIPNKFKIDDYEVFQVFQIVNVKKSFNI